MLLLYHAGQYTHLKTTDDTTLHVTCYTCTATKHAELSVKSGLHMYLSLACLSALRTTDLLYKFVSLKKITGVTHLRIKQAQK